VTGGARECYSQYRTPACGARLVRD
jgi:hypothetical protein